MTKTFNDNPPTTPLRVIISGFNVDIIEIDSEKVVRVTDFSNGLFVDGLLDIGLEDRVAQLITELKDAARLQEATKNIAGGAEPNLGS